MSKVVYGWVVIWNQLTGKPQVSVDLFFSSREKFEGLLMWSQESMDKEVLVPVVVPDDFDDLDYIPRDY